MITNNFILVRWNLMVITLYRLTERLYIHQASHAETSFQTAILEMTAGMYTMSLWRLKSLKRMKEEIHISNLIFVMKKLMKEGIFETQENEAWRYNPIM